MSIEAFGGSRFLLAVLVFLGSAVLLGLGKLTDGSFTTITTTTVLGLIAGHTYENVKTAGIPASTEPPVLTS